MNNCCKTINNQKQLNNNGCWKKYNHIGPSIYLKKNNVSSEQLLFSRNIPSYFQQEMSSRRNPGAHKCNNYNKHKKNKNNNFSFSEILNMRKSVAYYDPRAFNRI